MKGLVLLAVTIAVFACNYGQDIGIVNEEKTENVSIRQDAVSGDSIGTSSEPVVEEIHKTIEENAVVWEPEKISSLSGKIIVVDPGHGKSSYTKKEPVAPGSSTMKAAFVSGTSGATLTEEQLNLIVGLKLKEALKQKGAIVHMTRETYECDVSNVDRAIMANELNADIAIRIHADGSTAASAHGVTVLVPGNEYIKDEVLISKSRTAGEMVLNSFVEKTGAKNRGISVRNDLTGFNWSKVPVVLVEMGFMSNPEEDARMSTEDYQDKMVSGMLEGLEKYFE